MARGDSLSFDIIGNDRASTAFSRVGESVSRMGDKMDFAARHAAFLDDALKRQEKAARVSVDATLTLAKADSILADAEHGLTKGALEAEFALKRETEAKRKSRDAALEAAAANRQLRDSGGGGVLGGLGRLFSGGGGGGAGSALSVAGIGPWGLAGIGGAAALASSLLPGLVGLGVGGGVGALGVGGALLASNYAQGQVKTSQAALLAQQSAAQQVASLQRQIAAASGPRATAAQRANLPVLQQSLGVAQMRSANASAAYAQGPSVGQAQALAAPFAAFSNSFQDFGASAMMTFAKSIAPILRPVAGIFGDLGKQIKLLQPVMTQMFQASVPFIRMFADLLGQTGKILMPAFTQSMNQMVKSGALTEMSQGLVIIVKGLAGFITDLGPGMKSSAMLFRDVAVIINGSLRGIAIAAAWMANATETAVHWLHDKVPPMFDDFRHRTAVIFDGARHDIAHTWDQIYQNSIGTVIRFGHDVERDWNDFRHRTAVVFDGIRGDIAHYWDMTWNNTVGRVARGVGDTLTWIKTLPGRVLGVLGSAGKLLFSWGSGVITGLLTGMTNVIGGVWTFIKNIPGEILHFLGIRSPPQWAIDAGKHIMNGIGIGMGQAHGAFQKATSGLVAATQASAARIAAAGSGVARWAPVVQQALKMEGLPSWLTSNVLYQMQTESGGNPAAINLWDSNAAAGDPSRGLMQVIMSTFQAYHWPGTSWNIYDPLANIAAALNYARHVYGPTLMNMNAGIGSGHGYAAGTSWARRGWAWVGEHGPELLRFRGGEQVIPAGAAGGMHGGGTQTLTVIIKVDPAIAAVTPDRRLGRVIAEHVLAHTKSGGRLYPQGMTPR